tara:strand:- start:49016 stop:49627 length:612 start_codon:yes stop_codon:yes gene_type:complete
MVDITVANADITLGQRLRDFRKSQGMTLADLSKVTGINVSSLSKIENGKTSVNFSTVLKIAEDLSLPITNLIGPVEDPTAGGRRAMTRNGEGRHFEHPRWNLETLCDDMVKKRNVWWKMLVKCRSVEEYGEFSRHPGEEFLLVLNGVMDLYTETYKPVRLEAGDSICFDSMTPHAYIAVSDERPLVLMSNTVSADTVEGFKPD